MAKGKILIADGNKLGLDALAGRLVSEGYEVLQATDGSQTVSTVRSHRPDLILLSTSFPPDVGHGGGALTDGFLILDWLKRIEEGQGLPIILVTDQDAATLQTRARAAGAMGLFQKPINHEALLGVLTRLFNKTELQPQ